jgi:hypothetical protein
MKLRATKLTHNQKANTLKIVKSVKHGKAIYINKRIERKKTRNGL